MRKVIQTICSLALVLACAAATAQADVPTKMNVQGRLTNGSGGSVPPGYKQFTFKIFDLQAGGVEIWPAGPGETQLIATDLNGLWSGSIGELIPLTELVFQSPVRWLEFTVDDGINPPETLPRVELKTNPYTYRAATSQQADSLGGSSLGDLTDRFVDVGGDVMSGGLSNNWTHHNLGSSIQADNSNDGFGTFWNDVGLGSWGLSADVSGDNNYWNIGVAAAGRGSNNQFEANRGVLAYADGTGSVNVGVEGFTGMSGTANYSGYFFNGDFLVAWPQTPGTGGVALPNDAIDNTEILDEPGIASNESSVTITFTDASPGTMTDLLTVDITIPADGYIHLHGVVYVWVGGAAGTNGLMVLQIDEDAGGGYVEPYRMVAGEYSRAGAANTFHMTPLERIFYKPAGTYTFRIEGASNLISPGTEVHVYNRILSATYYPVSYGTIVASVASRDAGDFESAADVSATEGDGGLRGTGQAEVTYRVDLRELELKVARAEAELERARREMVEARTGAIRSSVPASSPTGEERNR